MTEEEAHFKLGLFIAAAERLADTADLGQSKTGNTRLSRDRLIEVKRYLPTALEALDTLAPNQKRRKFKVPYRAREELLSHALNPEQVDELLTFYKKGTSIKDLARRYGVHRNTISNIINRAKKAGKYE